MARSPRYAVLAVGTLGQTATCLFTYGLASLVPRMRSELGLSLPQAGALLSAPVAGLLLTLVLWGVATDRWGERATLVAGLGLAGAVLCLAPATATAVQLAVVLGVAGAAGASVNAASGRVVLGWFPARGRGTAMGVRQSAQPLGVALGAAVFPPLAAAVGLRQALLFPALLCLLAAVLVLVAVADPPQVAPTATVARGRSPYADGVLTRIHASSALLVVPQFATASFAVEFLVRDTGRGDVTAGRLMAVVSLVGAAARVVAGRWSDRLGTRLRPMRVIAVTTAAATAVLALSAALDLDAVSVGALVLATAVSASPNGLAFTAVAERAGSAWSGRALGIQNTGQNLTAVLAPPVLGALVTASGFGSGFAVAAVAPVLAAGLVPVRAEAARAGSR